MTVEMVSLLLQFGLFIIALLSLVVTIIKMTKK